MEKITLNAKKRDLTGKKVSNLRKDGFIPASLYGHDTKPINLMVNFKEFKKAYDNAGATTLVDLVIADGATQKVLIHDVQFHPVTEEPLHADFYKIKMTEEIETEVPLEFVGEAPAVKDLEGNLITNKKEIKIKCLPTELISELQVDISGLKTFDDKILISDLKLPNGIEILEEPEDVVALVNPPRSEEELAAMEEEAAADTEKAGIEKMEADAEAEKAAKEEAKTEESTETKPEEKKEE